MPGLTPSSSESVGDGVRDEFRRFGEIRLAVEIEIEGGADQRNAAKSGERRAGKPSQRRTPAFGAVEAVVAQADRRLDAQLKTDNRAVAARDETGKGGGRCRQACLSARSTRSSRRLHAEGELTVIAAIERRQISARKRAIFGALIARNLGECAAKATFRGLPPAVTSM